MMTQPAPAQPSAPVRDRSVGIASFIAGGLAAALGIAIGEFIAGVVAGAPSLLIAIGDLLIELQPPGAKDLVVELFGLADKVVLNIGIAATAILIAGFLGVAGRRNFTVPVAGFIIAGLVGLLAALAQPLTDELLAVVTLFASVAVAIGALWAMLMATNPTWRRAPEGMTVTAQGSSIAPAAATAPESPVAPAAATAPESPVDPAAATAPESPVDPAAAEASMPDWDRRRFLQISGGVAVSSIVLGVVGRNLLDNRPGGPAENVVLPTAAGPVPSVPPSASFEVPGVTPIVVSNEDFYRIDTALISPRVDVETWQLTLKGMVDNEVTLNYEELSEMPLFEQYVTIACVSNMVGGDLVGNALWTGVELREVLDMAGVQPDATQIVGRSVDGWTAGFPTAWAMDPDRRPMIALGMNGSPLPLDHGYPARLIIPGLYGFVSATKWLSEIELTTLEAFDGYWIPRGWAKIAPILTQSRIDVPAQGATVAPGPVGIGGVAWAPDRGISGVEVSFDDSEWQAAEITVPLSDAAWVQWQHTWQAEPGDHRITVRATDGNGVVQTAEVTRPAPDGARGHHSIMVRVA
jgi:DMSO/TMAO reductase YedYZ molybdopterin-dependent catalytic subunit